MVGTIPGDRRTASGIGLQRRARRGKRTAENDVDAARTQTAPQTSTRRGVRLVTGASSAVSMRPSRSRSVWFCGGSPSPVMSCRTRMARVRVDSAATVLAPALPRRSQGRHRAVCRSADGCVRGRCSQTPAQTSRRLTRTAGPSAGTVLPCSRRRRHQAVYRPNQAGPNRTGQ
jgi:hypothetical protein